VVKDFLDKQGDKDQTKDDPKTKTKTPKKDIKIKTIKPPESVYHASWNEDNIDKLISDKGKSDPTKAGSNFKGHANTDIGLYTSSNFSNDTDGGGVTNYGKYYIKMDIDKNAVTVDIKDIMGELELSKTQVLMDKSASKKIMKYAKDNNIDVIRDTNYHKAFHIVVDNKVLKNLRKVNDQFDESKCPDCGLIRHENNPNHAPKGDSKGGQFTKGDGAGSEMIRKMNLKQ
jgi:hypothetical protein